MIHSQTMIESFETYALRVGFSGGSVADWKRIKSQYRKFYLREYSRLHRQHKKRVEIIFGQKEFETIFSLAQKYGEKTSAFIRKSTLAYAQSKMYLPLNDTVEETRILLRKNSNNINQLVKFSHIKRRISDSEFMLLVGEVEQIHKNFEILYQSPKTIFCPLNLIT